MGRFEKSVDYLKNVSAIKTYLKDTPKSIKNIKTNLKALDMFFPYLLNRFKIKLGIEFDLKSYLKSDTETQNELKSSWKAYISDMVFAEWRELSTVEKANVLMKWKDELVASVNDSVEGEANENTFLNYMWRVQGLFSKMGKDYAANPKHLKKIQSSVSGRVATKDLISFIDLLQLYDKMDHARNKILLKILMYTGLNPADICRLKPEDFKPCDNPSFYYVMKPPEKSKDKDVMFLFVVSATFFCEIKTFFEITQTHHLKKIYKKPEIDTNRKNPRFRVVRETATFVEFESKNDWKRDNLMNIFGDIDSRAISDAIQYYVHKHGLNPEIKPMNIRWLCFTRLLKVFPLGDKDLYDLWTQHKGSITQRNSPQNYVNRVIPYLESGKIPEAILLETTEGYRKQLESVKKDKYNIASLQEENAKLREELHAMHHEIQEIRAIVEKKK